jgi:hypothetical protein
MASGVHVLLLDELFIARRLLERGEARGRRPPGRPLLHTGAPGSRERGGAAEQPAEEEGAKPLAAFGIHPSILGGPPSGALQALDGCEPLGSLRCSARWAISSST